MNKKAIQKKRNKNIKKAVVLYYNLRVFFRAAVKVVMVKVVKMRNGRVAF